MTIDEAISEFKERAEDSKKISELGMKSYIPKEKEEKQLAEWLEKLKQYRAIGTPEECREAVEKQTAKKVKSISQVKDGDSYVGLIGRCPCCGDILEEDTVYCDCGQKLDWRDEE